MVTIVTLFSTMQIGQNKQPRKQKETEQKQHKDKKYIYIYIYVKQDERYYNHLKFSSMST